MSGGKDEDCGHWTVTGTFLFRVSLRWLIGDRDNVCGKGVWCVFLAPPGGEVGEGFFEDGADGEAFGDGEVGEVAWGAGFFEALGHVEVDAVFEVFGGVFPGVGVKHVGAAVFEEAGFEVEVFEGVTGAGGDFFGLEVADEVGVAFDAFGGKGGFVGEEDVAGEVGGLGVDFFFGAGGEAAFAFVLALAEVVAHLEEAIFEAELVLVDKMGEDIAGGTEVEAEVGEAAGGGVEAFDFAGVGFAGDVGFVLGEVVFAGEEPAAKAGFEWDLVALLVAAEGLQAGAGHGDEDGFGDEAGDVVGGGAGVTGEAAGGAFGDGDATGGEAFVDVEHGAHFGVDGGDFDAAAGDPAEVGVVVEVERAGIAGVDDFALEGGGGEDEDLGADGDFEGLQD